MLERWDCGLLTGTFTSYNSSVHAKHHVHFFKWMVRRPVLESCSKCLANFVGMNINERHIPRHVILRYSKIVSLFNHQVPIHRSDSRFPGPENIRLRLHLRVSNLDGFFWPKIFGDLPQPCGPGAKLRMILENRLPALWDETSTPKVTGKATEKPCVVTADIACRSLLRKITRQKFCSTTKGRLAYNLAPSGDGDMRG